jgi:hypothetical protein
MGTTYMIRRIGDSGIPTVWRSAPSRRTPVCGLVELLLVELRFSNQCLLSESLIKLMHAFPAQRSSARATWVNG